jgi:hypothetical protein
MPARLPPCALAAGNEVVVMGGGMSLRTSESPKAQFGGDRLRPARDHGALAPCWISIVLALEIQTAGWRPRVPLEIRKLIRDMSLASPLWGAPHIHGELLKLGIAVGQTSVAKYMARRLLTRARPVSDR